jgi:membrane protease YdiL (CAAX protease family)
MNQPIYALLCLITGFLICHFIPLLDPVKQYFSSDTERIADDNTRFIIFQRLLGIFFYGFIPLLVIILSGSIYPIYGLNFHKPFLIIIAGGTLGAVLLLINFLNRKNPANLSAYPQIRKREWTKTLVAISAISWLTYLFAYEFLFRGYLLFSMFDAFGPWNAIAVNIVLYSLVHVPKGWKEATGSIPLGIIFCILCLKTGNIWPAFIAHAFLALSNEWLALKVHPSISLK